MSVDLDTLTDLAIGVLGRNRQTGTADWNGRDYDFVCPSHVTYPFQWFWDSCFHAVVLGRLDRDRARSEVEGLLANQADDGSIPHVIFWQRERYEAAVGTYAIAFRTRRLSDQMQPPVLAEAVQAAAGSDAAYVASALPAVRRYYDWCDRVRDPDGDGLIAVLQADETGLDHSPKFDDYLGITGEEGDEFTAGWRRVADAYDTVEREPQAMFELDRFVVEDVMVNTIYAENLRVLADLLETTGDVGAARIYRRRAERTESALLGKCWDGERGLFFDLAGLDEKRLTTSTITCLLPLLLRDLPPVVVTRLVSHLRDPNGYAAAFPVPSVSRSEPSYRPGTVGGNLVWRGPTWMNSNWYLVRGLLRHGVEDLARLITGRSAEMVLREGYREYYNPETGEGNGAVDFGWSTLIVDMVHSLDVA